MSYWRHLQTNFQYDDSKIKEMVIKDSEVIGISAAILLTVSAAGLTVADGALGIESWVRVAYVTVMFMSAMSAFLACYQSARMVLTLNKTPAKLVVKCMVMLQRKHVFFPYGWFMIANITLIAGMVIGVEQLYGSPCFKICTALGSGAVVCFAYSEYQHVSLGQADFHYSELDVESGNDEV